LAARRIPATLDYAVVPHLRAEAREKLSRVCPADLSQAARISGITPADLTVLMVFLEGRGTSPHFSPHGGVAAVGEAADGVMGANRPGDGRIGDSQRYGTAIRGEHASFYTDHNRLGADRHRLDV
jgi:hypothetical protein